MGELRPGAGEEEPAFEWLDRQPPGSAFTAAAALGLGSTEETQRFQPGAIREVRCHVNSPVDESAVWAPDAGPE